MYIFEYREYRAKQYKQRRKIKILRSIKDRKNPFEEYNEQVFYQKFRLRKTTTIELLRIIQTKLTQDARGGSIPDYLQLSSLRFYATGSFYRTIGDTLGISR